MRSYQAMRSYHAERSRHATRCSGDLVSSRRISPRTTRSSMRRVSSIRLSRRSAASGLRKPLRMARSLPSADRACSSKARTKRAPCRLRAGSRIGEGKVRGKPCHPLGLQGAVSPREILADAEFSTACSAFRGLGREAQLLRLELPLARLAVDFHETGLLARRCATCSHGSGVDASDARVRESGLLRRGASGRLSAGRGTNRAPKGFLPRPQGIRRDRRVARLRHQPQQTP